MKIWNKFLLGCLFLTISSTEPAYPMFMDTFYFCFTISNSVSVTKLPTIFEQLSSTLSDYLELSVIYTTFVYLWIIFSEMAFVSMCRGCSDVDKWRCDNGWCIPERKLYDGIPDCPDASDEHNRELLFGF